MKIFAKLISVLVLIVISIPQKSLAQPMLKFTEYKSGGIMDHSRVSCYEQDSKGLLWFGTWIGLCRFDGKDFHFFRNETTEGGNVLGSNRIIKMILDSQENLWCQNYDLGLYRFDRKTSVFQAVLPLVEGIKDRQTIRDKAYVMQRNHAIWCVLTDGTLVRFNDADPSINEVVPVPEGETRHVYEVREDSRGREWILTNRGTYIYGQGLISDQPYSRLIEKSGHCFLSITSQARLDEYTDEGHFRPIPMPGSVKKITHVQTQAKNQVALGTDNGLLLYYVQEGKMEYFAQTEQGREIGTVSRSFCDSKGRIWCFHPDAGLYCCEAQSKRVRFLPNPSSSHTDREEEGKLNLIMEDAFGVIWAKTPGNELCWVDEQNFFLRHYNECTLHGEALPILTYNFYFVDKQKNLWVSSGTKLYQLTFGQRQFNPVQMEQNDDVRSLLALDSLHVLAGNKTGVLSRSDLSTGRQKYLTTNGQWKDFEQHFDRTGVYCMYRDNQNKIWVGTRGGGIYELSPYGDNFKVRHFQKGDGEYDLNCNDIYDFYQDEYGRIWVATFGGGVNLLSTNQDGEVRFLHAGNEMRNYPIDDYDVVRSLNGDGQGHILAGTNKGVLAFSTKFDFIPELSFYTYDAQKLQDNPIQDNMIMQVLCDSEGDFYVCSYGRGLSKVVGKSLDSLSFVEIPNLDFPAGDVAMSAIAAHNHQIWMVAECGITCYNTQENRMWYFDEHDFDQYYSLTECTPIEMPGGRLVFGMKGGIFGFQADSLRKSNYSPRIVFTESSYSEGTTQHLREFNDIDTLQVLPDQRSSNIHFSALDFVPSRLILYAYWMHGVKSSESPRWVNTRTPEVNFADLNPGLYQLHVRSTNSDGVWCDNERILTIQVIPTFWERWGMLFYTIVLIVIVLIIILLNQRRLRKKQILEVRKEVSAMKIEMLSRPSDSADQEFIQRLMGVLEKHLADGELQVNDLADEMYMSRATLYRRLKQSVDLSPNDFIHQVRMRRSAEMLAETEDSIAQIAYSVGYNNPKYFSKCFKQDYGVSPVEYRAKARQSSSSQMTSDSNVEE